MDKQNGRLKAVKERYESANFSKVSKLKMPAKEEMKDLIIRLQLFDETPDNLLEETPMNTTTCSIASSGYEGDEEDFEDMLDSEDDEEMLWYDEGYEEAKNVPKPNETPKNSPANIEDQSKEHIERSTPSFLSPNWFLDVVNQSRLSNSCSVSLGSNTSRENATCRPCNSVGACVTPASMHSRRPLMDVNNRLHGTSSGNSEPCKAHTRFRPIENTPTSENVDMNC